MGSFHRGRSNRAKKLDKEYDKHQKMFHEIKELRQEIDRLNTVIKRMDKGACQKCAEEKTGKKKEKPVKTGSCPECKVEDLAKIEYAKGEELWAFDRCGGCGYRSVGKKI